MRQLCDGYGKPQATLLALAGLMALFVASCHYLSSDPTVEGSEPSAAGLLPLGSWKSDRLHCAAGRCERWYEIRVEESGVLKVDLYAPAGRGLPDCEMQLETLGGDPLPARTGRVRTQRRLRYEAKPATYKLRVSSKGPIREVLDYELFAQLSQERPKPKPRRTRASRKSAAAERTPLEKSGSRPKPAPDVPVAKLPPPSVPAREIPGTKAGEPESAETPTAAVPVPETPPEAEPETEPVWVVAEVLDVEETSGEPSAVMIEAGEPEGMRAGMQGELFEGEAVIGEIEIVEVYPTGSRARIVGPLSAPVSFDTFSRIRIPPDGE